MPSKPTIDEFVATFPRAGGFVYVLTNEAHQHLQKIGFTTRSPADRAAELDTTGSPHPFAVSFALYQADPYNAEQRLHAALALHRVRREREFFAVSLVDAVAVIMREFGEESIHFDPEAITPAGKVRLAQMYEEETKLAAISDRAAKAGERLTAALNERSALQERLDAALYRYDLIRRKPGFLGFKKGAAEKVELAELQRQMEEMDARLLPITAEYSESNDAWHQSGAAAVDIARMRSEWEQQRRE